MEISELMAELEKHQSSSYGWALSCCGRGAAEAEDVLQTTYLKILEGKACYRGEASFKTWLFAVIRKTAASERRNNVLRRLKLPGLRSQHDRVPTSEEPVLPGSFQNARCFFAVLYKHYRHVSKKRCIWSFIRISACERQPW